MEQHKVSNLADAETSLGTWTVDLRTQRCFFEAKLSWLFGLTEQQGKDGVEANQLMEVVSLPDREGMLKQWQDAMMTGSTYDIKCRIRTPDGVFHPIRSIGACHRDDRGVPYLFSGHIVALPNPDDQTAARMIESLLGRAVDLSNSRDQSLVTYLLEMARIENRKALDAVKPSQH